jgi:hypothetical protein
MTTDHDMILKNNYAIGGEGVFWPVVKRHTQSGRKTGKTRTYILKCGHYFICPAADASGKGETSECNLCSAIWRFLTEEGFASDIVEHAIRTVNPDILTGMYIAARMMGKLIRSLPGKQVA